MTKREFLGRVAVGTLAAVAQCAAAAEPLRILGDRYRRLPEPAPARERSHELERLVAGLRVGRGCTHGPLHALWLHGPDAEPRLPIATLDEARAGGALLIRERGDATVDRLVADNRGKAYVVLLAGEIVLGGKQNRVVADDLLLPPSSGPREIPVYCVEHGRWVTRGSNEFGARGSFAAPGLRARVVERGAQTDVWAAVSRYATSARAVSPTGSYQAIYERPEVMTHQQAVAHAIAQPPAGSLGAAIFVGGRLTGLDLFADADVFRREWAKLLSAQAIETYGHADDRAEDEGAVEEAWESASSSSLLCRATAARRSSPTAG